MFTRGYGKQSCCQWLTSWHQEHNATPNGDSDLQSETSLDTPQRHLLCPPHARSARPQSFDTCRVRSCYNIQTRSNHFPCNLPKTVNPDFPHETPDKLGGASHFWTHLGLSKYEETKWQRSCTCSQFPARNRCQYQSSPGSHSADVADVSWGSNSSWVKAQELRITSYPSWSHNLPSSQPQKTSTGGTSW